MARKAREKSKTGKYIVMLKGIEDTIFKGKKNQEIFTELIKKAFGKGLFGIRFFNDHVVMLLKESKAGIGMDMKPVLISFARTANRNSNESGKVFADRFKSIPVETKEYEAAAMSYINRESKNDPFTAKRTVSAPAKAKAPAKPKTVPKAKPAPKAEPKVEEKPEVKKEAPKRNNLPTWLL